MELVTNKSLVNGLSHYKTIRFICVRESDSNSILKFIIWNKRGQRILWN